MDKVLRIGVVLSLQVEPIFIETEQVGDLCTLITFSNEWGEAVRANILKV